VSGDATKPLPLAGIRVADFTWAIAGPQAARVLADLGAEVIRVENEAHLDSSRLGSQGDRETDSYNTRPLFNNLNRNKLSITANLNHPSGRAVVERLIAASDVLVENFSAGVLVRLGLGYDRLRELNPRIIAASLSGFGQTGRDARYITWGHVAGAVSGCAAMSGLPGYEPASWGHSYLDHVAGFHGAIAVLMALRHREQTGAGQYIDISQIETGMTLCGVPVLDFQVNGRPYERVGNRSRHPAVAPHGAYRCRDDEDGNDRWIAVAADTEAQWGALCGALGLDEAASDPRFATNEGRVAHQDVLDALIGARTRGLDALELMYTLQAVGVTAGLAQTARDKLDADPQLAYRGFYPMADHPDLGVHRFEGFPARFSNARWRVDRGAPRLGEHTRDVLTRVLGYSDAEVDALAAEAAV
jgi:crotonobetainyl-CoA:carnitine CoA-transferase CaiB-like acyl-CoA transferase